MTVGFVNSNFRANNFQEGYTTTATAAGTTTLTVASTEQQYFTGSSTQTVTLPVTSTLVLGHKFMITNNSSGVVTVQSSGGNTLQAMAASTQLEAVCILITGTGTASWMWSYAPLTISSVVAGPGSSTDRAIATWNGTGGATLFNNSTAIIDSTGRMTNSAQPRFQLQMTTTVANATGDGTNYDIVWDTTNYDIGSNTSSGTTFTTPVTGCYSFKWCVTYTSLSALFTAGYMILRKNGADICNMTAGFVGVVRDSNNMYTASYSCELSLTATDTITTRTTLFGSTKTVGIGGSTSTGFAMCSFFSGYLIC